MKKTVQVLLSFMMSFTLFFNTLPLMANDETSDTIITRVEDSAVTNNGELFKVQYSDFWGSSAGMPAYFSNGDEHYANAGAYFEMSFIGTRIQLFATKASNHGEYTVTIDGDVVGTANATSENRIHQQEIFDSGILENKQHKIKVELPRSSDKAIQFDFAEITHGQISPESISLSETDISLETGMTKQLNAIVLPDYATNKKVVWSTSDANIASISQSGLVTAVSNTNASATITATVEGTQVSKSATIRVSPLVDCLTASVASTDLLETQDDYDKLRNATTTSWSDIGWIGDILNSKVAICTKTKVHNASVVASDFISGKHTIDASNVEIKWLKEVQANIGRSNVNAPVKNFPDVIHKGGTLDIPSQKVQFAWININIPKDAKPGLYTGTISVNADEMDEPFVLNYSFEVLDLIQPTTEETNTQIQVWQHPFSVANYYGVPTNKYFSEDHFKYMRGSMQEYASIGGHDVVANIVEEAWNHQSYYGDPSMVKWTKNMDGTYTFDYTWYDAWINFQIECGVLDPENNIGRIKCYSIVPWGNQITYTNAITGVAIKRSYTPGEQEWKDIWTVFLRDFMEHSKEKGWFDITYISMDERSAAELTPAIELLNSITDENGKSFKISSAFNYSVEQGYSLSDNIDDISINLGNVSHTSEKVRDLATHRRSLGLTTTIYTCTGDYPSNYTISDPIDNAWVMWYTMCQKNDGFMRWAWDNWVSDPLTNVTYQYWEPGDGWFIYPVEKDVTGNHDYFYSTPRYEMLKKGIRDINKAKYLMTLSDDLNTKISELVASMNRAGRGTNGYGSAVATDETQRMITVNETNRMRNTTNALAKEYLGSNAADKSALQNVVDTCNKLNEEDYTPSSWAVFKQSLDDANVALENPSITQATVDEMKTNLEEAKEKLVKRADLTNLQKTMDEINKLNKDDYTTQSWAEVEKALADANGIKNNKNVTQDEVNIVTQAMRDAIDSLILKPVVIKPAQIKDVVVTTNTYSSVKLTWSKIEGVAQYEIARSTKKDGTYSTKTYIDADDFKGFAIVNKLKTGQTYWFKVRAIRENGLDKVYGSYSSKKSGTALMNIKPVLVSVTQKTYGTLQVTWKGVPGAQNYYLERREAGTDTWKHLKTFVSSARTAESRSLDTGTKYEYRVRAGRYSGAAKSSYSNIKGNTPVMKTTTVSVVKKTATSAKVSWKTVSGASGYEVYRATNSTGKYSKIKTLKADQKSLISKSLTKGKTYYYKVRAYRNVNDKKVYNKFSAIVKYKA